MDSKRFPVITLWQPWASFIAAGEKRIETRSWKPSSATLPVGSIIMIHAAKKNDRTLRDQEKLLRGRFPDAVDRAKQLFPGVYPNYPLGAIIASCRFVGVYSVETIRDDISEQERAFGNYADGRYGWELEVLKIPEKPILTPGKQGIWWWSAKS